MHVKVKSEQAQQCSTLDVVNANLIIPAIGLKTKITCQLKIVVIAAMKKWASTWLSTFPIKHHKIYLH